MPKKEDIPIEKYEYYQRKKEMKRIIRENIDILLFSIALLFIELLLRLYVGFDLSKQPFIFDLAYIILFDGLLMLLKSKPRRIIEIIFILIPFAVIFLMLSARLSCA